MGHDRAARALKTPSAPIPRVRRATVFSRHLNTLMLPLRLVASHRTLDRLGLRSMRDERVDAALAFCQGRVLDIGCGEDNLLARRYAGSAVGVDVHPWPGVDLLCDTANLPFADGSFDTVTMLAVLNHIPERKRVLDECRRVLTPGGRILVTMIGPLAGVIRHRIAWWDRDQSDRVAAEGELPGLGSGDVVALLEGSGFRMRKRVPFVLRLNALFVAERG